jgi:hypothetical protein
VFSYPTAKCIEPLIEKILLIIFQIKKALNLTRHSMGVVSRRYSRRIEYTVLQSLEEFVEHPGRIMKFERIAEYIQK